MERLYIAGSLFNEAEVNQRIKEGNMIERLIIYLLREYGIRDQVILLFLLLI